MKVYIAARVNCEGLKSHNSAHSQRHSQRRMPYSRRLRKRVILPANQNLPQDPADCTGDGESIFHAMRLRTPTV